MTVITCVDVTKSYGRLEALQGLSFTIEEHTITGLIGRNGSGKTTLLRILVGQYRETSGKVRVFNDHPFNSLLVSANSILVDDTMAFPKRLNLSEILTEAERFYAKWDKTLAQRLLNYFSLDGQAFHHQLSKGKRSTFNMIIGLASRCALTLFDEPTTGMDAAVRKDFYRALLKDYLDHPRTIILSNHHLEEMEDLLEDVLLVNKGANVLHLSVEELRSYALSISGEREVVQPFIEGKELIHRETRGETHEYIVVKQADLQGQLEEMRRAGLQVNAVSLSDLGVYLTRDQIGGIDDVFNTH